MPIKECSEFGKTEQWATGRSPTEGKIILALLRSAFKLKPPSRLVFLPLVFQETAPALLAARPAGCFPPVFQNPISAIPAQVSGVRNPRFPAPLRPRLPELAVPAPERTAPGVVYPVVGNLNLAVSTLERSQSWVFPIPFHLSFPLGLSVHRSEFHIFFALIIFAFVDIKSRQDIIYVLAQQRLPHSPVCIFFDPLQPFIDRVPFRRFLNGIVDFVHRDMLSP